MLYHPIHHRGGEDHHPGAGLRKDVVGDCAAEGTGDARVGQQADIAHPYPSWERGANENTNGLIRQYLPKDRNLKTVTDQEEPMIMDRLNLRPSNRLDFKTPLEVFF
jgi:hypothetical protein